MRMLALAIGMGWCLRVLVRAGEGALSKAYAVVGAPAWGTSSRASVLELLREMPGELSWALLIGASVLMTVGASGAVASAVSVRIHRATLASAGRALDARGRTGGSGATVWVVVLVTCACVGVIASGARAGLSEPLAVTSLVEAWLTVVVGALGAWFVVRGLARHWDPGTRRDADDPRGSTD